MTSMSTGLSSLPLRIRRWFGEWQHERKIKQAKAARSATLAEYLAGEGPFRLHLGCGPHRLAGWLNSDISLQEGTVYIDITEPLPFPAKSIDYIFAEHLVEHFDLETTDRFLSEFARVLKPGGKIRLVTPDLDTFITYGHPEPGELKHDYSKMILGWFYSQRQEPLSSMTINAIFREWGHRFIFDMRTLKSSLEQAGLAAVSQVQVGESDDPVFRDVERHGDWIGHEFNKLESLVVEAMRPGA